MHVMFYCFRKNKKYTSKEIYEMYKHNRGEFDLLYSFVKIESEIINAAKDEMNEGQKGVK